MRLVDAGDSRIGEAPHTVGSRGQQRPVLARSPRLGSLPIITVALSLKLIGAIHKRPVSGEERRNGRKHDAPTRAARVIPESK